MSNGFQKFISGKGFYLALAVCLAGAGAAAWVAVDKTIENIETTPLSETPQVQQQADSAPAEQKLDNIAQDDSLSLQKEEPEDSTSAAADGDSAPADQSMKQQINADALRRQFGSELTGTVVTAVCNIKYADKLFIKGAAVPQDSREQVSRRISQESMERFLNSVTIDFGRIENPVAYLQTSLYTYHQKLLQPSQAEPVSTGTSEQPLADWELEWLKRVKAKRHSQETE